MITDDVNIGEYPYSIFRTKTDDHLAIPSDTLAFCYGDTVVSIAIIRAVTVVFSKYNKQLVSVSLNRICVRVKVGQCTFRALHA